MKQSIKKQLKKIPLVSNLGRYLDNRIEIDEFVKSELETIPSNSLILDAGCGNQLYRKFCAHLNYRSQDFGQYTNDLKTTLDGGYGIGGTDKYAYGNLDYVGDIWDIDEKDETFDAILCTEVFEHIPYPIETVREFSRLLKADGKLIITAPSNCLRHMDPYFFYTGFSDRWYEKVLTENGLGIEYLNPIGDYYRWLGVEIKRTAFTHSIFAKLVLAPTFLYFYSKTKTQISENTLCLGYHVVARKLRVTNTR